MLNQKINNVSGYITFSPNGITISNEPYIKKLTNLPNRYIINDGATILFWSDGTKTIVKRSKEDEYNKILGFLWAYFQKTSGLSKSKANEYLKKLEDYADVENHKQLNKFNTDMKKLVSDWNKSFERASQILKKGNIGGTNDKNS